MHQGFKKNWAQTCNTFSRRDFLKLGTMLVAVGAAPRAALAKSRPIKPERGLCFHNLHTGERLKTVYWAKGRYLREALSDINYILRDYRTDEVKAIDLRLLDLLHKIQGLVDTLRPFQVVSGYRSPSTNAMLAARRPGVAKRSLHMQGKAVDISIPGVHLAYLRRAAIALRTGGVGYYPRSNFVHVDVGPVRTW